MSGIAAALQSPSSNLNPTQTEQNKTKTEDREERTLGFLGTKNSVRERGGRWEVRSSVQI
jgi:hypothetical protein